MKDKYLFIRRMLAVIIMVAVAAWLVAGFWHPVRYVFSGDFLASRFRLPSELPGDSYQVGINRMLLCSLFTLGIGFAACLTVRWLMGQCGYFGKWAFRVFALIVYVFPFCCVIIALHMLGQYIWAMGFTFRRVLGIGVAFWILLFLIGTWLLMIGLLKTRNFHHKL